MHKTCCFVVIHLCAKFGMPMSKSKEDLAQTKESKYNFYIAAKGIDFTLVMNACGTSSHGDILMCQIIIMSTDKKVVAQARSHEKKQLYN